MSQQPVYYAPPYPQPRSNGLGIAGFIVSLVGLVSCGVLSPVGLVLSFIALFRSPRGFAVAGVVLGLLGCIGGIIALIAGLFGLAMTGVGLAAVAPIIKTEVHMAEVAQVVAAHKGADGSVPTDLSTLSELPARERTDAWGHALRVVNKGSGEFEIISDGPDGVAGTSDDLVNTTSGDGTHHRVKLRRHGRPVNVD